MDKAVFLDSDGPINAEKHYLHKIEDFEFLLGVVQGLKMLQQAGYLLIIITNQSGIGRGYYTEDDFKILNSWMIEELEHRGIHIAKVYYCPHLPNAKIEKSRKPALGLYERAVKDFDIELNCSYAIGDKIRDCAVCFSSKCRGFLIGDNENADTILDVKAGNYRNVACAKDLIEAVNHIVKGAQK